MLGVRGRQHIHLALLHRFDEDTFGLPATERDARIHYPDDYRAAKRVPDDKDYCSGSKPQRRQAANKAMPAMQGDNRALVSFC